MGGLSGPERPCILSPGVSVRLQVILKLKTLFPPSCGQISHTHFIILKLEIRLRMFKKKKKKGGDGDGLIWNAEAPPPTAQSFAAVLHPCISDRKLQDCGITKILKSLWLRSEYVHMNPARGIRGRCSP